MSGFSLVCKWVKGELFPSQRPVLDGITNLFGQLHNAGAWTLLVDSFGDVPFTVGHDVKRNFILIERQRKKSLIITRGGMKFTTKFKTLAGKRIDFEQVNWLTFLIAMIQEST